MALEKEQDWDIIIDSKEDKSPIFNIGELFHYVDLLWLLVKRDFTFIYKQTILGPIWIFLQPLFTTVIYMFIFGRVAGLSTEGLPKPLFYLSGIVGWGFFSETLNKTAAVFSSNAHIFGKIYFPRIIVPLSLVASNFIKLLIQLLLFVLFLSYFILHDGISYEVSWRLLWFPVLIIIISFYGLGAGLIISSLTTKYKDLVNFLLFGVQLLMFATPIIYPISAAPPKIAKVMMLNPLSSVMEYFRFSLLGVGTLNPIALTYSILLSFVVVLAGVYSFRRAERSFIDTI